MTEADFRSPEELTIEELRDRVEKLEIALRVIQGSIADVRMPLIKLVEGAVEACEHPHETTMVPSRWRKKLNEIFNTLYPKEAKDR